MLYFSLLVLGRYFYKVYTVASHNMLLFVSEVVVNNIYPCKHVVRFILQTVMDFLQCVVNKYTCIKLWR